MTKYTTINDFYEFYYLWATDSSSQSLNETHIYTKLFQNPSINEKVLVRHEVLTDGRTNGRTQLQKLYASPFFLFLLEA